jgi:transposase
MDAQALPDDIELLKKLLRKAQQDVVSAERKTQIAQQQIVELSSTIADQQRKLALKDQRLLELLRERYGKKRERVNRDQLLLFEIGELETLIQEQLEEKPVDEQEQLKKQPKKRKGHGRRVIPDDLPREVVHHELPPEQRLCPHDQQPMERIRWEVSVQLDYVPAKMKVIEHRRAVYACATKHDEAKLITAPKPPQPIEKGLPTAGLLAQVVLSKFGDHLPGYRQEDIFARHRLHIRRSTIYDWISQAADLCLALYVLMKHRVLASKVIHTDDTSVKLMDKELGSTKTARFWCYVGDRANPYSVYDFTSDRSRAGPTTFLQGFSGYLQADAYGGYDGIYLQSDKSNVKPAIEVACWVHARRYWFKAKEQDSERAHYVLAIIGRLYEVERACAELDSETRKAKRQEHAAPLLGMLNDWLAEQELLPKSLIGQAANYTRNQWTALNRYVEDGDLSIDNNTAERAMRPVAIGRKNWLFVGSEAAGSRATVLMSLIASCKNNHVEPWAYLQDVLSRLAQGETDLEELLPDRWLQTHPTHRWEIADQRKVEGK